MVTSRQLKEKFRDYRRAFKHSWQLFKASRLGLFGLVIMVGFIVVALISPYLGLRHPIDWLAPDEDIIRAIGYFNGVDGVGTKGVFDQGIGYRLSSLGVMGYGERLYIAGGDGSPRSPYGIYAYDPDDGDREWNANGFVTGDPFGSRVSTDVVVNNFGSETNDIYAENRIFFGCENGRIYMLKDDFGTARSMAPPYSSPGDTIAFTWERQLDGVPSDKIAVWQNNSLSRYATHYEYDANDIIFASTDAGTLYAFRGPVYDYDTVNGVTNLTYPTLFWSIPLSDHPLTAPIVSPDGRYVYVGSRDGKLYGILVASGLPIFDWGGEYTISDSNATSTALDPRSTAAYWSSNPVCIGTNPIVYATTDDGFLHSVWGINGTARAGWEDGLQIRDNRSEVDGGNLTDPYVFEDGSAIIFGSSTGIYYSIGNQKELRLDFDTRLGTEATEIIVQPFYEPFTGKVFVLANALNGTASDYSDDYTILYALGAKSNVTWRKTLPGMVLATPVSYNPAGLTQHLYFDVVMATVKFDPATGEPEAGEMYSFASQGENLCPLPPTWVEPSASGNTYWLGTDDRGHDILSQTLLGSRLALLVGFMSAIFSIGIGVIVGLVAGYYGGNVDAVLMRFTDVVLTLPALPLLIVFAAMMSPSVWNIIFIIAILGWAGVARIIRAEVLSLKERPFIDSARVTGASKSRIMFRHIAPNVLPLALLYMTFAVAGAILYEAALSFIGLGDPTAMTWGMMLNYVQHSDALGAWWWLLPPGICITLVCLAFFLLGRAFDEIVNPRLRRR